jgi:hypothetical protein
MPPVPKERDLPAYSLSGFIYLVKDNKHDVYLGFSFNHVGQVVSKEMMLSQSSGVNTPFS